MTSSQSLVGFDREAVNMIAAGGSEVAIALEAVGAPEVITRRNYSGIWEISGEPQKVTTLMVLTGSAVVVQSPLGQEFSVGGGMFLNVHGRVKPSLKISFERATVIFIRQGVGVPRSQMGGQAPDSIRAGLSVLQSRAVRSLGRLFLDLSPEEGGEFDRLVELVLRNLAALLVIPEISGVRMSEKRSGYELALISLEKNAGDPDFSVEAWANSLHVSRRHLIRLVEQSGKSPSVLLRERRAELAVQLMPAYRRREMSLAQIAQNAGFPSVRSMRHALESQVLEAVGA